MEPSKEAIAVRLTRLNRLILGKVTGANSNFSKRTIDREALLDALTVLYDDCNDDPIKKGDDLVQAFVDKYRSTVFELRRTRVCLADFHVLKIIGRGHFGEVHMVREKETGDVYALKTLRKEASSQTGAACVEEEREILATTSGSWLPRLQYAFQDNTNLYLVMELCSGGDLAGLLARRDRALAEKDAAFYIAEVVHALKLLHSLGYVHRDIKPDNILIDRCGHIKLGDFGSCVRVSEGRRKITPAGTPDYVAPELLAAADCAARHQHCVDAGRGLEIPSISVTACDYWSLGVMAFELVTLRRPFSSGDDDEPISKILSNIQKYERRKNPEPPFPERPEGPSNEWRALVKGLLTVQPSKRFSYLDTMQSAALRQVSFTNVRDQVPPWVPSLRGPEDAAHFMPPPRRKPPPNAADFSTRQPFGGQLPFIGFSYVAPDDTDECSSFTSSFNSSLDCTAIDMTTFKSAEKLAVMRAKEIANLQKKLAEAEAAAGAEASRARRAAHDEAEMLRARLQAEITALSLQNKRLERQLEIEKEERMALERNHQEVSSSKERSTSSLRAAQAQKSELEKQTSALREELRNAESRLNETKVELARARQDADSARAQQKHYKDSVAKERALRRQTLSGCENENREAASKLAAAEASAAKEARARDEAERKLVEAEKAARSAEIQLDEVRRELASIKATTDEKKRIVEASIEELKQVQLQLTQERVRSLTLVAQVQDLQQQNEEAVRREAALEEQSARTEARLQARLNEAEARATEALNEDARHREKVHKLEQLVRQLEREVNALEARNDASPRPEAASDTESVDDVPAPNTAAHAQIALLKEQLEKAESQLQARADEMAALRQEARTANLARWRKEKEFNDLQVEAKTSARDLKRLEERISTVTESRRKAEQKNTALQNELSEIKPKYEAASKELQETQELYKDILKRHEVLQAEVDRSRNDILKLKSELQYSERRRLRAEKQEELGGAERHALRDEAAQLRATANQLEQNNKGLQEACSMLEDQLMDLEKLADLSETKNRELEKETTRLRDELSTCRAALCERERSLAEATASANSAARRGDDLAEQAERYAAQVEQLTERLNSRESLLQTLESKLATLESERTSLEAALNNAGVRMRALQEECAAAHTRAHDHNSRALALQARLNDAQEEIAAAKEAAEGAAAWWRTRETKADATLRQQAKLIDFLQAKVEEANRKKCSLSNKLFGRSGRRPSTASPPLRRANRELREEVEKLRSKLAAATNGDFSFQATPKKQRKPLNGTVLSIDTPDCAKEVKPSDDDDSYVQIVWKDGRRERVKAVSSEGVLTFSLDGKQTRGRLIPTGATLLLHDEASRAFTIRLENADSTEVSVVCNSTEQRSQLTSALRPLGYWPPALATMPCAPLAALLVTMQAMALGTNQGLRSLRGPIRLEWESDRSELPSASVTQIVTCAGRAILLYGAMTVHASLASLDSALRRAENLRPAIMVSRVRLPDTTAPHLIHASSIEASEGALLAVACGRRVFLLRFEAAACDFRVARSLTVDRAPAALLLTPRALLIAGEKPLRILLPNGALEAFAIEEPIISAAAKKRSPPKAMLLIRTNPIEILLCYAECGVFVDENGKRTRSEDPKWKTAVDSWQFVNPFLYAVGTEGVTITYINEEAFKSAPCTCDNHSVASTPSEGYIPQIYTVKLDEPVPLGTAPNGIIVRNKAGVEYAVSVIEGLPAFRSIGASVESLETISDSKGSSTDLAHSLTDLSPQEDSNDVSQESVEPNTGFLADIRKRAQQLKMKNNGAPDDVIKKILTSEIELKRRSSGRPAPSTTSEYSTDSESDEPRLTMNNNPKSPADLCAEMFTKQVRFH